MIYVGIDPGLSGAVAVIDHKGNMVALDDTPTLTVKKAKGHKRVYVESQMVSILERLSKNVRLVGIENVHAMPGQGVTSMFSMGSGFGLWLGILAALRMPYEKIEPAKWKREMGITSGSDKSASIVCASHLFPTASFRKDRGRVDTMDGRADALLLAEWLRRKFASL